MRTCESNALRLPVALLCLTLAGCATTQSAPSRSDPWERVNRSTYAFNHAIDSAVLKPVARGYRRFVPRVIRTGVTNFLSNLAYPTTIVNDALQAKFKDALSDTGRFVLNSTAGFGGLLDPATHLGLPRNDEDFGQTLGRWGMPPGPYLMLPLLGPSTARDAPSLYADYLTDARHYLAKNEIGFAFAGLSIIDLRTRLLTADEVIEGAYDRYALIRNAYLDRRNYQVHDGDVPEQGVDEELWLEADDAGVESPAPEGAAGESADDRQQVVDPADAGDIDEPGGNGAE
jgi:phospholipid-binding lipoprotein MlaA